MAAAGLIAMASAWVAVTAPTRPHAVSLECALCRVRFAGRGCSCSPRLCCGLPVSPLFVASSLSIRVDPSSPTDAIVVLTGGRLRLETGLELFATGSAKKLFISGVNQRVDRDELLRALGPAAERAACCIVLGHEADNTFGNARETANWMHEEGYKSLRLVTSWYHMRRGLLEFGRAMPQGHDRRAPRYSRITSTRSAGGAGMVLRS